MAERETFLAERGVFFLNLSVKKNLLLEVEERDEGGPFW